jgi:hypothetical protein
MSKDIPGKPNINFADHITINYHITTMSKDKESYLEKKRASKDIIHSYMPSDVEEMIWRQAVIENIHEHVKKLYSNPKIVKGYTDQNNIKTYRSLEELPNKDLWRIHEYVIQLEVPERTRWIEEIETIRKKRKVSFSKFKTDIAVRLKMKLVTYEKLSDKDLRLLHGFVVSIW